MLSTAALIALGATAGAVALGAASAASGNPQGLSVALQHIPPEAHGYDVVEAVKSALAGGAAGGGIGAVVSIAAKALAAH